MTARKLSRRVALRGGAAVAAMTAMPAATVAASPAARHEPLLELERQNTAAHDLASDLCNRIDRKELAYRRAGIDVPDIHVQWQEPDSLYRCRMAYSEKSIRSQASPEFVDRLMAELDDKRAERDRLGFGVLDAADERARSEWRGIEDRIAATPATTPEGIAVKLRLLIQVADLYGESLGAELANAILADLDRIGGAS